MRSLPNLILLSCAAVFSISVHARTWTSTDGRAIEASLVSKGDDFVVLRLDATGGTVTVKHSQLSAGDLEFIKTAQVAPDTTAQLALIISKFPALPFKDENGKQLNEKYQGFAKIMTPATAFNVAQMMRVKLVDDVKYWKEQSERVPPPIKMPLLTDPNGPKIIEQRHRERQEKIATVKGYYKWVSEVLPKWLTEVEKAASQ